MSADGMLPAEAEALLYAMAFSGIRVDDRKFEHAVGVVRGELARLRGIEAAAQAWVDHMAGSRDVCMGTAAALIAAVDGGGA